MKKISKVIVPLVLSASICFNIMFLLNSFFNDEKYRDVEIRYEENGEEKYVIGVIPDYYVNQLDEKHKVIYAYGINDINTDFITYVELD